jgi:hypothetical protein
VLCNGRPCGENKSNLAWLARGDQQCVGWMQTAGGWVVVLCLTAALFNDRHHAVLANRFLSVH